MWGVKIKKSGSDIDCCEGKISVKEFFWPFIVFTASLVVFEICSKLDFRLGILIIFGILLSTLIKKTRFLFYMFVMSLPFTSNALAFRIGFFFKINYLFFGLVMISFIYNRLRLRDYSLVITPLDAPLFVFLAVAITSIFQTRYASKTPIIIYDTLRNYPWMKGFVGVMFLIFMYLVYYLVINILSEKGMFKRSFFLIIITSSIASLWGLFGFFFSMIMSSCLPDYISPLVLATSELRIRSTFEEPLFFGNFLMFVIPIIYCLIISKTGYINECFMKTAAFILTAAMLLTVSRSTWFTYLIFIFLFIAFYWQQIFGGLSQRLLKNIIKKEFVRTTFFVMLVFAIFVLISSLFFEGVIDKTKVDINNKLSGLKGSFLEYAVTPITSAFTPSHGRFWSTRTRFLAMQYAWEGFKQHPILGIGYSNFLFYSGYNAYEGLFAEAINFPEVNDYPLKVLAEMGIVGFLVFIWLILKTMGMLIKGLSHEKDPKKKALLAGCLFSFAALGVQLLFFSYVTLMYIWFMIAMMVSVCDIKRINLLKETGDERIGTGLLTK